MFERLLSRLTGAPDTPAPLPVPDARLALAALLVRVARADQAYLFEEVEQTDRVLAHAFDLKPLDAAKLRAEAERFDKQLPGDADLAGLIRRDVDPAHRRGVAAGLWAVARADGYTDDRAAAIAALVETHLGVTGTESGRS